MNEIVIEIAGIRYTGFTDISVTKTMDTMAGSFRFAATSDDVTVFPIKVGDSCSIIIVDVPIIKGFVEIVSVDYSAGSHSIIIEGRDKTADIIDSTLFGNIEITKGATLEKVIKKVLDDLDITDIEIINNVSGLQPFTNELESGKTGQNAFDFIQTYCRKRQVIVASDGLGNILIQRAGTNVIPVHLLNQKGGEFNNIISSHVSYNHTQRFNSVKVKSQGNSSAFDVTFQNIANNEASATDSLIRSTRKMVVIAESSSDKTTVQERATWEVNIRRARSFQYSVSIQDFTYDKTNLWLPNNLVNVLDQYADVEGQFLIRAITYAQSLGVGSAVDMTLTTRDAYNLEAEQAVRDAQENKAGGNLIDQSL